MVFDLATPSNALYDELAKLMMAGTDPYQIAVCAKSIMGLSAQCVTAGQKMIPFVDEHAKVSIETANKKLATSSTKLIRQAGLFSMNQDDDTVTKTIVAMVTVSIGT